MTLTVHAGVITAPVYFFLTVGAVVVHWAVTSVAPHVLLHACATIETRPVSTRHGTHFAVLAVETLRTGAFVVVLQVLQKRKEGRKANQMRKGSRQSSLCTSPAPEPLE